MVDLSIDMKELEGSLTTRTCVKCYYSKDDRENYRIYAITRSYSHLEQDWRIQVIDSLLEISDIFNDMSEYADYLRNTYERVEKVTLPDFLSEVIKTSSGLDNRWEMF